MVYARRLATLAGVLASTVLATAPAFGQGLTLDPFAQRVQGSPRQVLLLDMVQATTPAGAAGGAPTLPPVQVSGQGAANPGNLHLLPDTRELEAAPYRRTLFTGLIDPKSVYGKAWFPENLRNPEMDLEFSEGQVRYFHQEKKNHHKEEVTVVYEHSFNSLTLEIELPWQNEVEREDEDDEGERADGLSKVELGMRYPLFQIVSTDGNFDYTCVGTFEVALPTHRHFSMDTELSPRIYQLIRIGDHFSVQTNLGTEHLIGPDRGGTVNLIFGATLGYAIYPEDLKIPFCTAITPIFEVVGEHVLTGEKEGGFSSAIFGTAGVRLNLENIGGFQPRIGAGWVFPLSAGAREEMRFGIITSVIFEF